MGLYSRNRISSIAVKESDDVVDNNNQETSEVIDDQKDKKSEDIEEATESSKEDEVEVPTSIDPDVEAMLADDEYSFDESYFDQIEESESFSNLIDVCVNIHENDRNLFEKLIELDFNTVCAEHTLGTSESVNGAGANDAKRDNIITNINKIFVGTESAIKQSGLNMSSKLAKLIENDNAIYQKYTKVLENEDSIKGFTGVSMYFPSCESVEKMDDILDFNPINKILSEGVDNIAKSTSKEEVDSVVSGIKESLNLISKDFISNIKESITVRENWIPDNNDINIMKEFANNNIAKKALIISTKESVEAIEGVREDVEIACEMCDDSDELNTYKLNKIYEAASTALKSFCKKYQIHSDLLVRETAALRKGLMISGNFAIKHTMLDESTLLNVMENSDTYVYDLFDK